MAVKGVPNERFAYQPCPSTWRQPGLHLVLAASPAALSALLQTVQCRAADQVLARPAAQAAAALAGAHAGGDWACGAADCALPLGPCGAVRCV